MVLSEVVQLIIICNHILIQIEFYYNGIFCSKIPMKYKYNYNKFMTVANIVVDIRGSTDVCHLPETMAVFQDKNV